MKLGMIFIAVMLSASITSASGERRGSVHHNANTKTETNVEANTTFEEGDRRYREPASPPGTVIGVDCVITVAAQGMGGGATAAKSDPACVARRDVREAEDSCYSHPFVPAVGVGAGSCDKAQRGATGACLEINNDCLRLPRLREIRDLYIGTELGWKDLKVTTKRWLPWILTWWY